MRVLVALAWLAVCSAGLERAHAATANIDKDGFTQDGKTTYCEGVAESRGPLVFEHLLPSSAGKCPLSVTLSSSRRVNKATGATEIRVDWRASLATGIEPASSLFPRAVDADTGLPQRVIASLLRACKAGSNCATDSNVLVPAAGNGNQTSTGEFDAQGQKPLRRFIFSVDAATVPDLVIVAKVVLPGDAQLNVSATEFITFQRVRLSGNAATATTTSETVLPGTVKPASGDDESSEIGGEAAKMTSTPATKSPTSVDAQDTSSGAVTTPTQGGTTNIVVLSSIAGLGFIIAVAYFATAKKGAHGDKHDDMDHQHTSTADASLYRLTDAAKQGSSVPILGQQPPRQRGASLPTANGQQSRRFQSRQQRAQAPWQAPAGPVRSLGGAVAGRDEDSPPPALYHADLSVDGLTTSAEVEPSTSSGVASELLASQLTSFNSLHDSAVTLPTASRPRRASSASSYADELDDSDHEGVKIGGGSSRLFNESHISEVLQHQSQYPRGTTQTTTSSADRSTSLSSYSWLEEEHGDRDSDDLVELTTAIHERYTSRRQQK